MALRDKRRYRFNRRFHSKLPEHSEAHVAEAVEGRQPTLPKAIISERGFSVLETSGRRVGHGGTETGRN